MVLSQVARWTISLGGRALYMQMRVHVEGATPRNMHKSATRIFWQIGTSTSLLPAGGLYLLCPPIMLQKKMVVLSPIGALVCFREGQARFLSKAQSILCAQRKVGNAERPPECTLHPPCASKPPMHLVIADVPCLAPSPPGPPGSGSGALMGCAQEGAPHLSHFFFVFFLRDQEAHTQGKCR